MSAITIEPKSLALQSGKKFKSGMFAKTRYS
jgi:hypothetical protein